jgi:hypothetical protein
MLALMAKETQRKMGRKIRLLAVQKKPIDRRNIMPSEAFQASRLTKGNFLFPTVIEVGDKAVVRRKRSWFSRDEISISVQKIASVHIKTGLIWADILIESSGGTDPLASHGHRKADARRIKELIENYQAKPLAEDGRS